MFGWSHRKKKSWSRKEVPGWRGPEEVVGMGQTEPVGVIQHVQSCLSGQHKVHCLFSRQSVIQRHLTARTCQNILKS